VGRFQSYWVGSFSNADTCMLVGWGGSEVVKGEYGGV